MKERSIPGFSLVLLAIVVAAPPPAARAQSIVSAGAEFRVNQYTTGAQRLPSAVAALDGTYCVVWESEFQDGSGLGVFGRFYSSVGVPLGPEFQVNQATVSDQHDPAVTVDSGGRYTVVWAGPDGSGDGVFARQYSSAGPLTPEYQVNTYTTGDQTLPRVSAGPVGVGVVWQSSGQDGSGAGVIGRFLIPTGVPMTEEVPLSTTTLRDQSKPVVAALSSGTFAVAWLGSMSPSNGPRVFARLFHGAGTPLTPEIDLSQSDPYRQDYLGIVAGPGGTFAVTSWAASFTSGKFGFISFDGGVTLRYLDAGGTSLSYVIVNSAGQGSNARWEGSPAADLLGNHLVGLTSAPGVLTCFLIPPPTPPTICDPVSEDGSGAAVFARALGPGTDPTRVRVNTYTSGNQSRPSVAMDLRGNSLIAWQSDGQDGSGLGVYAQRLGGVFPASLAYDPAGNGVLDPGLIEEVRPSWVNRNGAPLDLGGTLFGFSGPAGATYTINDGQAAYGAVANDAIQACTDCYQVSVSAPTRPSTHWDAYLGENLTPARVGLHHVWTVHVGGSFTDVSASSPFYRFIETLLHGGVTGGCNATAYCPGFTTGRDQMAVFVLVAKQGPGYLPPACTTPMFADVPATSAYCRWIEELARRGVVTGCGDGNYCPTAPVTREQMAIFVLRTLDPALNPPACTTPVFGDVPASSPFCAWIEELARRGVVTGCGGGNYCPTAPVTREQMAVFLTATFGLRLY